MTDDDDDSVVLTVDPRRQFGRVCLHGTRVPAEAVAGCVWGGDSVDAVAGDYETTRLQVLTACWWYVTNGDLHLSLSPKRRKEAAERFERWARWRDWAAIVLGGWAPDAALCDPDDYAGEYDAWQQANARASQLEKGQQ